MNNFLEKRNIKKREITKKQSYIIKWILYKKDKQKNHKKELIDKTALKTQDIRKSF